MRPAFPVRALRTLAIALLAGAGVTCRDAGPTGPGRVAPTAARLLFTSALAADAPGTPIAPYRKAHVELFTLPSLTLARDTTIVFADGDTTSTVALGVTVTTVNQRFLIALTLLDDQDRVVYVARDTVTAFIPGSGTPPVPTPIVLTYSGADTAARALTIAPRDTTLTLGAAVRFRASARRADNSLVAGATIGFSARGTGITVDADGTVHATAAGPRGTAMVIARLATGVSDSTIVTVIGPPSTVVVTPDTATLQAGGTLQLAALVRDAAGSALGAAVTWSSADTTIATVSAAGLALAKAPGTVLLTARAGTASGTARLVVVPVPVARIVLSPDTLVTIDTGTVARFTAQAFDANGNLLARLFTWTSSDAAVAFVFRDSLGRGIVQGLRVGTATVTATVDGLSASAPVRVTAPRRGTVTIAPRGGALLTGDSLRLSATVLDTLGQSSAAPVAWSVAGGSPVVTVNASTGMVTARQSGTAFVVASALGGRDSVAVQVRTVASIVVTPATASVSGGQRVRLAAAAFDSAGTPIANVAVRWAVADTAVAVLDSAFAQGAVALARRGGTTTVSATAYGRTGSATITVAPPRAGTITIAPRGAALLTGDTLRFSATVLDSLGQPSPTPPAWSVAGASPVIGVDAAGLVAARQSGTAILVASANGAADSVTLTVRTVASIVVTPASASLSATQRVRLAAAALDSAGAVIANVPVRWTVADTAIAVVDSAFAQDAVVLARRSGTTTVSATAYGRAGGATLTVAPPRSATVGITPRGGALITGDSLRLAAAVLDTLGQPSAAPVTWSVAGGSPVVTVNASTGMVTARQSGTALVIASALGARDSVAVQVRTVASISVTPASASIAGVGLRTRLTAVARDSAGASIDSAVFTWSVGDPTVASLDTIGPRSVVLLGLRVGGTSVSARGYGLNGGASLTVDGPPPPVSITVTPSTASLASLGELVALGATVRDAFGGVVAATPSWTTRDPAVATVDASGVVRATGNGVVYVLAQSGALSDSARITVRQLVDTILVSRDTLRLALGDTATVTATLLDANRNAITDVAPAFASSDPAIATVTAGGRITLVASGTTRVLVSAGGRTTAVVVMQGQGTGGVSASLAWIRITPGGGSVRMGGTMPLVAELVDANGVATTIAPSWASDQPGRAPVSVSGVVTLNDTTTVTITATSQGIAGHATFGVLAAPAVTSFSFAPTTLTGVTASTVRFSVSVGAADPGDGISAVAVEFTGPGGVTRGCTATAPTVGTTRRGTWDCAVSLPAGSPAGAWHATRVSLAGTIARDVAEPQLATFGGTTLTVTP